MEIPQQYAKRFFRTISLVGLFLTLFLAIKFLAELKSYNMMGSNGANTITLSGHGEVQAVPDIASISFTIEASEASQVLSSEKVNTKTKGALDFIKSSGVDEKDIKTDSYSSYPKYSYPQICTTYYSGGTTPPCRSGEQKIIGYTVSQNITVKVRKVDDASKIIDGINKIGVTNMYGPNFTIDNEDGLKAEARKKAIDNAREKAKSLAKDLGVRLGRISSFSESGNYPIMYAESDMAMKVGNAAPSTPSQLPKGENTISSDVTISYEIK